MGPDQICEKYSRMNVNLKITEKNDLIIIEGSQKSLEFLGNLIIAQSEFDKDCGFSINPNGAGGLFFDKNSKKGLYIHRLPCTHKPKNK